MLLLLLSHWGLIIFSASALVFLFLAGFVSAASPTFVPSSSGAASSSSSNSTSSSPPSESSSVLLALGDSFTFGETNLIYLPSDGNRGYPADLASLISSSGLINGSAPAVWNFAIDGETTRSFVTGSGRFSPVEGRTDVILRSENNHYSAQRANFTQLQMFDEAIKNATSLNIKIVAATLTLGFNDLESLALQPGGLANISETLDVFRIEYGTIVKHIRNSLPDSTPLFLIGYFNPYATQTDTPKAGNNYTSHYNQTETIAPFSNTTTTTTSTTSSSSLGNSSNSATSARVTSNPALPIYLVGGPTLNFIINVTAAAQSAIFVELSAAFYGHESAYTYIDVYPSGYYLSDSVYPGVEPLGNFHPNNVGYRVIAGQIFAKFNSFAANVSLICNQNDINALNLALTLEHLEWNFYQTFQSRFNSSDFASAGFNQYVYPNFALIAAHEFAHVQIITNAIITLGGSPVPPCSYNFSAIEDVKTYVAIAKVLENTAVKAYDGALNTLTNIVLKQAGATIATVEARHAAYLNQQNAQSPFPDAFDTPDSPIQVVQAVLESGFVLSCPFPAVTPVVLAPTVPSAVARNYTSTDNATFISPATGPNLTVVTNSVSLTPITIARYLSPAEVENDIKVMNFALLLENTDAHFFIWGQSTFTQQDFVYAGYQPVVYGELNSIAAHELAHATALNQSILALGGTPLPPCQYDFSKVKNVTEYFRIGRLLENTGVGAYDGGINAVSSTELQQFLSSIATVEARHAGSLNGYNYLSGFPEDRDTPLTPPQVIELLLALKLIVSCPFNITEQLPQILPTAGACPDIAEVEGGRVPASGSASGPATPSSTSATGSTSPSPSPSVPASGSTSRSSYGSGSASLSTGEADRAAVIGGSTAGLGNENESSSGVSLDISSSSGTGFSFGSAASSTGRSNSTSDNNSGNNGGNNYINAAGLSSPMSGILSLMTVFITLTVNLV